MAQNRFYSSTAVSTTLNGTIAAGTNPIVVTSTTGFPVSFPYTLILERDTANEEVVTVTAAAGTSLTVSRGQDGTSAVSHTTGVSVVHGVSARDFTEPQAHIGSTTAVHGVTGALVGTTDTQTLSGKTLTNPTFAGTATGLSASSAVLDAASTVGGVSGTTIAADHAAWTAYTPTLGGVTSAGTVAGRYLQMGKTLFFSAQVQTSGTLTSAGSGITFTLPNLLSGFNGVTYQACSALPFKSGGLVTSGGIAFVQGNSGFVSVFCSAWVNGDNVGNTSVSGVIQVP